MSTSGEGGGWDGAGSRGGQSGEDHAQRRSRKRTKSGIYTSDVTVEDLARHFHQPASKACQELGMGLTIFKRVCRKLGLQRWPYEKPTRGDSGSGGGQQRTPAAPQVQLGFPPGAAASVPGTGALSASQPWLMQGAGFQQQQAVGQQQQAQQQPQHQAQLGLYWDSAAPAGLGGWAPPGQPLSPGPSRSSRGLPAMATGVGQGSQTADLMAATLQLETALQQGGSSGLRSAAIQQLADVLVQDSAAAQELLAAIGQAIKQQQQAPQQQAAALQSQPTVESPAPPPLLQPLPAAMLPPPQQVQLAYAVPQPVAQQLPLTQQQQRGLLPASLQQQLQLLQQPDGDQLAAVLQTLRWAVQNDEQPQQQQQQALSPLSPPQPEPKPAAEQSSVVSPLLLRLLNWQQQQQQVLLRQKDSQQEQIQRERQQQPQQQPQQQQQRQRRRPEFGDDEAMLPEEAAQPAQEQQQQQQPGARLGDNGAGAQPAGPPLSATAAAGRQLQLSARPAELPQPSPRSENAGGSGDKGMSQGDPAGGGAFLPEPPGGPPASPAAQATSGPARGGSPVHQPQPLLQLPQGTAGLQLQGGGLAAPAGPTQQVQALVGALASGTLPPAALALLAAAIQSGAAAPTAPAAGGAAGAEQQQGSAAGEQAAAGGTSAGWPP